MVVKVKSYKTLDGVFLHLTRSLLCLGIYELILQFRYVMITNLKTFQCLDLKTLLD